MKKKEYSLLWGTHRPFFWFFFWAKCKSSRFFFVWNFALVSSVSSCDFCLKNLKKKSPHANPTKRRRGCARTRHHNDRPSALPPFSPFALSPLFCPTKIYPANTYDDASRHVSIHHRAHRGTPRHETAAEEPQKRVFGYRSRARVYRDG